jgi:Xaa-Pro aminopeptidase
METKVDYEGRIERVRKVMREKNLDCLYITAGRDMRYFLGWSAYEGGWPVWLSTLIIPLSGEPVLVISTMHYDIFKHTGSWVKNVRTYVDGDDPTNMMADLFKELRLHDARIGVDDRMWFGDYSFLRTVAPKAQVVSSSSVLDRVRMIKDPVEIEYLRKANLISNAGFQRAGEIIRAGVSEFEAAMEIGKAMMLAGSESWAVGGTFRTLRQRKFVPGDIVDIDIAGVWRGYSTDTARNVFVGPVEPEVERMYRVTVEAFDRTFEIIRPGVELQEIHRVAYEYMKKHGYEQPWKIGHGVGIGGVHEAPLVQPGETLVTEVGMVFVVDPGCFVPNRSTDIPIHIEDAIVVTENGAENLTTYTHDMVVV